MAGLLRVLVVVFSVLACASAWAGQLVRQSYASATLQREVPFLVYLPDAYVAGRAHFPVVYLLHGAASDENAWVERGGIVARMDRLIASGAIPPAVVVMPGCPGCWWVDGARDRAETAFWSELVPVIDSRFRTERSRVGRMAIGISAGGYGAVRFALRHPDGLAAVAALSPAIYSVTPPAFSAARRDHPFLRRDGQFNQASWTAQNYPRLTDGYFDQPLRVAISVYTGDRDEFGIAHEASRFYDTIAPRQPGLADLKVVEGRHDWSVWGRCLDGALVSVLRNAHKAAIHAANSN